MKRIRTWIEDNALMLSGMLLMLASAGVDGKFLSMWMSSGLQWLGYVLNFVSDSAGYVMSNAYGRLQNDEDETKRKLSRFLLVGEFVNIGYSWLFSYLVLRDRFTAFYVNPIFNNLNTEVELLSFVSAGFVPLMLVFLGYADSLNKTQPQKRHSSVKVAVKKQQAINTIVDTSQSTNDTKRDKDLSTKEGRINAMLTLYRDNPHESISAVSDQIGVSRQTAYKYLNELETQGTIENNGHGVIILEGD